MLKPRTQLPHFCFLLSHFSFQLFPIPMFDPTLPANNSPLVSAEMRAQLSGLKDLIDAIQTITAAQVDATNTLPPGTPAEVTLSVAGNTLGFTFEIPVGASGSDGGTGPQGIQGEQGLPGAAGEVSFVQLTDAIATTSNNSNAVNTLAMAVTDPPTQGEVQAIANKLDELILALRR
jgi:hypothetical protein